MTTTTTADVSVAIETLDHMENKPSFGDIPTDCIQASKTNPRKIFAPEALNDLAASIKKHGVAQPILVRPIRTDEHGVTFFEIVAGERRFRASILAGKTTVPAIVRGLSDIEALEIQVIENLQRQDLHPLEEAEGYEVLMKEANYTGEQMAEKVGKSKAYIYASLKLCALVPKVRKIFYDGLLTKSTALLIARIPVKSVQETAATTITTQHNGVMSTKAASDYIERNYMLNLKKAEFKPSDAELCPEAGSCTSCPKRTGNQPEIFNDVSADVCTDPDCYKTKNTAHVIRIKQLAAANGLTVISGTEAKKILPYSYSSQLSGGYVDLDAPNHLDPKHRTYRQILGKQAPQPVLLENPHSTGIKEIVKVSDIKSVLAEKGVALSASSVQSNESAAREKEQEAKAKIERAYRTELFTQIHHASLMMNLVDVDLRLIARILYQNLPSNTIPTKLVMSLHGWTDETFSYPNREEKVKATFDALSPAELNQVIRDCMLSHDLHVNVYTSYSDKDEPNRLLAMAERTKIDAKAIKRKFVAEAKAKADLKLKAKEKKSAKAPAAKAATPVPSARKVTKTAPRSKPSANTGATLAPSDAVPPTADRVDQAAATQPAAATAIGKPSPAKPASKEKAAPLTKVLSPAAWPFPTAHRITNP